MGSLTYDRVVVEIDDRTLAHLQIVIAQKLRRGESFMLTWQDSASSGAGRSTIWLNPAIPLYFKYAGGHAATINRQWVEDLTRSANSAQGLVVISEADSLPNTTLTARSTAPVAARTTARASVRTDTVLL